MSDIVIKAENLGKKYVIGHQTERGRYTALRDVLMQNARTLWNKTKDIAAGKPVIQGDELEEVWALQNVTFEVGRSEAVGIIGRNGAGKSTLLKILSRITEPSAGRVTIKGRVASLLEVGTGFHPELSGRENIYLNGTILGMTRQEIKRKFDEIVSFAEVEKYLDTPVKRYSSGMYVRLAFAVAAHLEPEIILIDEVLAVGDAAFQKKCLGKIGDVTKEGRTVLFVSHNMAAISHLCQRCIILDKGKVLHIGDVSKAIQLYSSSTNKQAVSIDRKSKSGTVVAGFEIKYSEASPDSTHPGRSTTFLIDIDSDVHTSDVDIALGINNFLGQRIITLFSRFYNAHFELNPGRNRVRCFVPGLALKPDSYTVNIFVGTAYAALDYIAEPIEFEIEHFNCYPSVKAPDQSQGNMLAYQEWSIAEEGE